MKMRLSWLVLLTGLAAGVGAEGPEHADEIVARANLASYYAGADGRSEVRMVIRDTAGREQVRQFTILRRNVEPGGDQTFLVAFSRPSDVRGTVYLVEKHVDRDDDRWLYLPGLDLVKRVSAGDKRTSFVGSHYYYEDVSGRLPDADVHRVVEATDAHWVLEHTPKDPASVEYHHFRTTIDRTTYLPLRVEYFDASGRVFRTIEAKAIETIAGHPTVVHALVTDDRLGGTTEMRFRGVDYDLGIPAEVFAERSLRSPPQRWLRASP
jgi:hypothetical protein